jgi:hypothetical protein
MAASVDPWIADELVALPKVGSDVPAADVAAFAQEEVSAARVGSPPAAFKPQVNCGAP